MKPKPKQVRAAEKARRRELLQRFIDARQCFLASVDERRRKEMLYTVRVWKVFILGMIPIPLFFHTCIVIDVPLLRTFPNLRLTSTGKLVHPPGTYMPVWANDRLFGHRSYSNDELLEMIGAFAPISRESDQEVYARS